MPGVESVPRYDLTRMFIHLNLGPYETFRIKPKVFIFLLLLLW